MTNNNCEDVTSCDNFPIAICLHCDRRLCIKHIIEHEKMVFADVDKLSKLTEETFEQIKTKSEKSRIACDDLLPTLDEWRRRELEKLQRIDEDELKRIKSRNEALEQYHRCLLEELERDARKPLERVQKQQNSNTTILNGSRQSVAKLLQDSTQLKWYFSTPSSVNSRYSPSEFLRISTMDVTHPIKQPDKIIFSSGLTASSVSEAKPVKTRKRNRHKKLVQMFSNTSSIQQGKDEIASYTDGRKTPVLVSAYLTAWNGKSSSSEKTFLLNEHISTIQKYLENQSNAFDVLVGIQAFFHNNSIQGEKHEMMRFVLEFFLQHRCIDHNLILRWYHENDSHGYLGYEQAKSLAKPFIQSLSDSHNPTSFSSTDQK